MSRVTVVTPCYNAEAWIADTLGSVIEQDFKDWDYIVVDDGSADDTPRVVERLAAPEPRIKLVRQKNSGTGRARNLGAEKGDASSSYLLFLDHDDMLEPSALRVMSAYLDAHPEVVVVGCQFQEIGHDGRPIGSKSRSRWVPSRMGFPRRLRSDEYDTPFATFYCATGQGPFAMLRRRPFEESGGWTTEFWPHEDTDLFCKMALRGRVHYLPDRLYRKRVHTANALNDHDRVMQAYGLLRKKWDVYEPRNEVEAKTLAAARHFYLASFRPLRHIKVGTKAVGESVRFGDGGKLRWGLRLYGAAVRDAIRYRFFSS